MADDILWPNFSKNNLSEPISGEILSGKEVTFGDAARSYISEKGPNRYLEPLIELIGHIPLRRLSPFEIRKLAENMLPTQKNSTRNRQVITPIRAVIYHAVDRLWCSPIRLRNFKEEPPQRKPIPSDVWMHMFFRQCDFDGFPHLAALVVFMSTTGARVSEAARLKWRDIDFTKRQAVLVKTKTGTNSVRDLTDDIIERLRALQPGKSPNDHAFTYTSRYGVYDAIKIMCERAGIPFLPPHTIGRAYFATRSMELGMDMKTVMDAGGWKTMDVFMIYVRQRFNPGRMVADVFNANQYRLQA